MKILMGAAVNEAIQAEILVAQLHIEIYKTSMPI